jgi:hypothetical protein
MERGQGKEKGRREEGEERGRGERENAKEERWKKESCEDTFFRRGLSLFPFYALIRPPKGSSKALTPPGKKFVFYPIPDRRLSDRRFVRPIGERFFDDDFGG